MISRASRAPASRWLVAVLLASALVRAQEPRGPQPISPEALQSAINKLGDLDYLTRMEAARLIRRAPPAQAVAMLLQTITEHRDGYVRFRALVLIEGFNDPRARDAIMQVLADPNDRLRTVAYSYFEHHPDPKIVPALLQALDREDAEFVRPALIRALAAHGSDSRVREILLREVNRGQDFFRSAVIEALGDHKAVYAVAALTTVAGLDGPLQDDAAIALGKIGNKSALATLAALQRSAPRNLQPAVAAAICLLGVNCSSHEGFVADTLKFAEQNSGFQDLLRNAATGLGEIAVAGRAEALEVLFEVGIPSEDPARAPIALALGGVALRNTPLMLRALETQRDRAGAIELLREAFEMLEEDVEKERFFVAIRRSFWEESQDSPRRQVAETLIQTLDF